MAVVKRYDLKGTLGKGAQETYKAGIVFDNSSGTINGIFYKSPYFYRDLFSKNDGFIFLHTSAGARPVGYKGYVYSKSENGSVIMLGTYKSAKKRAYFSFLRREWLVKLMVENDRPVVNFFVNMWSRI